MLTNLHRSRGLRALGGLCVVAVAMPVSVGVAQQRLDGRGLAFSAEAGGKGQRSYFTLSSARAMRRVDLGIVDGAKVRMVRRKAGTRVGTLTFVSSPEKPLLLTIARTASHGRMVLAHRGALRVVFAPRARAIISITGLPARTTVIELDLDGGRAQLISSQICRDEQNFRVTVWHAGVRKAVQDVGGVTC